MKKQIHILFLIAFLCFLSVCSILPKVGSTSKEVPVNIVDTTPPIVTVKSAAFLEGWRYEVEDILDVTEASEYQFILPPELGTGDNLYAHFGDAYTVCVKDASGNMTSQEVRLNVIDQVTREAYVSENEAVNETLDRLNEENEFRTITCKEFLEGNKTMYLCGGYKLDNSCGPEVQKAAAYLISQDGDIVFAFEGIFRRNTDINEINIRDNQIVLHESGPIDYWLDGATYVFEKQDNEYKLVFVDKDYEYTWFEGYRKCPEKYKIYMGKSWIAEHNWHDDGSFSPSFSVYFTKITDNYIEGRYTFDFDNIAKLSSQRGTNVYEFDYSLNLFTGVIENGVATCKDFLNNEMNFQINFLDDNQIKFIFLDDNSEYKCQPYLITSDSSLEQNTDIEVPIQTGKWAGCKIVTGVKENNVGEKYSVSYITDEDNDILYELAWGMSMAETYGNRVSDIQVSDENADGLEDIHICYDDDRAVVFYQTEEGLFTWKSVGREPSY